MKNLIIVSVVFTTLFLFSACRNKTVKLLTKKWDCVQVENILPPGTKFQSAEDSANFVQLQSLLQSLNWTFKKNMKYECAVNNSITVEGKYELLESDKILVCTPESKNNINRYVINLLTENELILKTTGGTTPLVLYFKPH